MFYHSKYGRVYYDIIGSGNFVVFLHGWGQDSTTFNHIYNELKNHYTILAIDLPGFGQSEKPNQVLSLNEYQEVLRELIVLLDITNPIMIGHSLGGRIALKYCYQYKDIKQLFLISSAGIKPKRSFGYYYKVYQYKIKKKVYKFFRLYSLLEKLQSNSGSPDYKEAPPIMKKTLSLVVNEDLRKILKYIDVETIILWGIYDDITPYSDALIFQKKIKNSTLVTFYQSHHFPYISEKRKFIKVIKKYLIGEDEDGPN